MAETSNTVNTNFNKIEATQAGSLASQLRLAQRNWRDSRVSLEGNKRMQRQKMSYAVVLFKMLFSRTVQHNKELLWIIQTRAWVIHCVIDAYRLIAWAIGHAPWLTTVDCDTVNDNHNCLALKEQSESFKEVIQTVTSFLIVVSALLNILCFKYRYLANYLLYFESLVVLMAGLSSQHFMASTETQILAFLFIFFAYFICSGVQVVCTAVSFAIWLFAVKPIIYLEFVTFETVVVDAYTLLAFVGAQFVLGLFVVYILQLDSHQRSANTENFKLLNSMHEGLILLSKEDGDIMVCNKQAQKLVNTFLGEISESQTNLTLFSKACITPMQLQVKEPCKKFDALLERKDAENKVCPVSIDQIIQTQQDEAHQRNCIYRLTTKANKQEDGLVTKYLQVRVESIVFNEERATAVFFYDMTHQIQTLELASSEVQEQPSQSLSPSLGRRTVTDELRTPLCNILMFLENIISIGLNEAQKKAVLLVVFQVNMLLCFVNGILDYKMIEERKFIPKCELFSPEETFNFVLNMFAHQAKFQNTTVNFKAMPFLCKMSSSLLRGQQEENDNLPEKLLGDNLRLQQVLIILLKNAINFTQAGQIRIAATYDSDDLMLQVHVSDTGKGLSQQETAKLSTIFNEVGRKEDDNPDDIGLSLTLCQKIVSINGGQIDVMSQGVNKGSTFMFTMKMKLPSKDSSILPEEQGKIIEERFNIRDISAFDFSCKDPALENQSAQEPLFDANYRDPALESRSAEEPVSTTKIDYRLSLDSSSLLNNDTESLKYRRHQKKKDSRHSMKASKIKTGSSQRFGSELPQLACGSESDAEGPNDVDQSETSLSFSELVKQNLNQSQVIANQMRVRLEDLANEESRGDIEKQIWLDVIGSDVIGSAILTHSQSQQLSRPEVEEAAEVNPLEGLLVGGSQDILPRPMTSPLKVGVSVDEMAYQTQNWTHVLIVEDNSCNATALAKALEQQGISSVRATNGLQGFNFVKERFEANGDTFKLIVMDLAMPICDGKASTVMIRKFLAEEAPAELEQPFICCLTSYQQKAHLQSAIEAGMDGYLTKPIFKTGIQRLLVKAGLLDN